MPKSLRVRLFVSLFLLILGFIGVIVTDIRKSGGWRYWQYLCIIYALVSLGLSWHLQRKGLRTPAYTLWHEVAHWAGLLASIFVASYIVKIGLISRFEASLFTLLLLALATFLAGVYFEKTFIVLGIALGIFATFFAFIDEYLYNVFLPLTILAALVLIFWVYYTHRKSRGQ